MLCMPALRCPTVGASKLFEMQRKVTQRGRLRENSSTSQSWQTSIVASTAQSLCDCGHGILWARVSAINWASHCMYGVPPVPRGSDTRWLMYSLAQP